MQFDLEIQGRPRRVIVTRGTSAELLVSVDGRQWAVDASRVDPHTLSLLVDQGGRLKSYEVVVGQTSGPHGPSGGFTVHFGPIAVTVGVNDPRGKSRKDDDGPAQAGPLQVRAVMPGRVVRVLVKRGDAVKAGQGLVVIEAMKMENELRAARDGRVVDVLVREATTVEAGALLVVIE